MELAKYMKKTYNRIFVTGGTGFIGKYFIKQILAKETRVCIYVLVREDKIQSLLRSPGGLGIFEDPRVNLIYGDVTHPGLAFQTTNLPDKIDEFWHIAGVTDFEERKREKIFSVNVKGTKHAIELASTLNTGRFFYISTAYAVGIVSGVAKEDELPANPAFRNSYEESKYIAEQEVRNSSLPWIVIRPSIVMGDSITGEAETDKTAYGIVQMCAVLKRLTNKRLDSQTVSSKQNHYYLTGNPESTMDIVTVDEVVRLMMLIRERGKMGLGYNVTAPIQTNCQVMLEAASSAAETDFIRIASLPPEDGDNYQQMLNAQLAIYEPYTLFNDPIFDRKNLLAICCHECMKNVGFKELEFLFKKYLDDVIQLERS